MKRRALLPAVILLLFAAGGLAAQSPLESAQQQFHDGHFSAAISTLQGAIQANPNEAAAYFWLGRCLFELQKYSDASLQFQHAIKIDPDDSNSHLWLGRTDGRLADQKDSLWLGMRTRKEFERAVQLDPKNVAARRDLSEFYTEAPWIVGGNKKKAREQVDAIAALDPVQGALARAEYDNKVGDLSGSQAEYRSVLKQGAQRVEEYYEIADFYAAHDNAGGLQEAIDGAARLSPNDLRLGYYRGVVLTLQGSRLDEAETYLKAYLAATPNRSDYPSHANARTWLGHVYERQGKQLEAAEQYRAALEIDPGSSFAKQSLKRLEKQINN